MYYLPNEFNNIQPFIKICDTLPSTSNSLIENPQTMYCKTGSIK